VSSAGLATSIKFGALNDRQKTYLSHSIMASENQSQRARDIYSQLKAEDDYPHWNELDISEMLAQGVKDEHIKSEWHESARVYRDSRDGAAGLLSRLSRFRVDRPSVGLQDIEE
jgi:hypothetical protein